MSNASEPVRERIGSAAAGIAHDINNQLTIIVNHLSLQNRTASIVAALAAADRCAALTASLLSSARGEIVQLSPLDSGSFLAAYLGKLNLPDDVRLVSDLPASLPPIAADPLALERALTNLISNACAAMNNAGTLRISASAQQIDIEDSGPGIPSEDTDRVFDPFFTTKGTHGTGLGLSIVREMMRRHGGSVTVQSEPGHGTRFTLRFRAPYGVTGFSASPRKIAPAA
jgi:two-component system NtrC family sensor kinase